MAIGVLVYSEVILWHNIPKWRVLCALLVNWLFEHCLQDVALRISLVLGLACFFVILEHFVKDIGQELAIRRKQLHQLLLLNLREPFDLLLRAGLDRVDVDIKEASVEGG